jgi:GT2 family glycosyltransferase
MNGAARSARGNFLCLLNNDIEMVGSGWLDAMMRHARRPGTGAVGALLLYPDHTIQHAGVAIGVGGAAGHVHRGVGLNEVGHHNLHRLSRYMSAVTAACLLLSKDAYQAVGGMDEENFAVAFNDVDLCLKLGKAGYRNIFAADAQLIHHESKSRGNDMLPANYARFQRELHALQERWGTIYANDPFHHPLLLRSAEVYALAPA